jgi:serine/threonine protein kinase
MEYIDGKSLREIIKEKQQTKEYFSEEFIYKIFSQIVSSLSCCHSMNIIHRDIKPENILITKEEQIKLIDFGLSKQIETISKSMSTETGTSNYMSPEIINEQKYFSNSDVWSLGCVLFELLVLNHPFSYKVNKSLLMISQKQIPKYDSLQYSPQLKELVQKMLCSDVNFRLSISNIKKYIHFLKFNKNIQSHFLIVYDMFLFVISNEYYLTIQDNQMKIDENYIQSKTSLIHASNVQPIENVNLLMKELSDFMSSLLFSLQELISYNPLKFSVKAKE